MSALTSVRYDLNSRTFYDFAAVPRGLIARAIFTVSGGTTRPEPHPIDIPAPSDRQRLPRSTAAAHHRQRDYACVWKAFGAAASAFIALRIFRTSSTKSCTRIAQPSGSASTSAAPRHPMSWVCHHAIVSSH